MKLSASVAEGSALGPDFWNVVYDEAVTMDLPDDTKLIRRASEAHGSTCPEKKLALQSQTTTCQ